MLLPARRAVQARAAGHTGHTGAAVGSQRRNFAAVSDYPLSHPPPRRPGAADPTPLLAATSCCGVCAHDDNTTVPRRVVAKLPHTSTPEPSPSS